MYGSTTTIRGRKGFLLSLGIYIYEILVCLIERLKCVTFKLIYCTAGNPVWKSQHLYRKQACPLEIDDGFDMSIAVVENVTCMQVSEIEHNGSMPKVAVCKVGEEPLHREYICHLCATVCLVDYRVWLVSYTTICNARRLV